jgi:hypothetical protein
LVNTTFSPNGRALNWYALISKWNEEISVIEDWLLLLSMHLSGRVLSWSLPVWGDLIEDKCSIWKCLFSTKLFNELKSITGHMLPSFFGTRKIRL